MPYTVLCALACSTCFYRGMSNFTKFPKIISFFFQFFPLYLTCFGSFFFLCLMYLGCLWLQITKIIPFLGSPRRRRVGGEAMSPCVYILYLQTVPPTMHSGASSSRVLGCGFNHAWWEKTWQESLLFCVRDWSWGRRGGCAPVSHVSHCCDKMPASLCRVSWCTTQLLGGRARGSGRPSETLQV